MFARREESQEHPPAAMLWYWNIEFSGGPWRKLSAWSVGFAMESKGCGSLAAVVRDVGDGGEMGPEGATMVA